MNLSADEVLGQRRQDAVTAAEEALEATESTSNTPADESQTGIYTEHVFTDPLGVQNSRDTPSNYTQRSHSRTACLSISSDTVEAYCNALLL